VRSTDKLKRASARLLIALFVLSLVPRSHAHHHPDCNSSHHAKRLAPNSLLASSDFDADVRPDRVTVHSNGYHKTIKIHFGNARSSQLAFTAHTSEPGSLVARDIDRDGDVDLVWLETTDRKNAVVWINGGNGNFAEADDSSQYTSELDDLFSSNDPSNNHSLRRKRKTSALASAFFHDVGLPLLTRFQSTAIIQPSLTIPEQHTVESHFVVYLRKRGPPLTIS
jgi:hypothetical protein